jgi:prepilin-type N-terminal cleavage/methylation domain-containing protein
MKTFRRHWTRHRQLNTSSKGFTIVELLVCIALAGVVITSLSQVVTTYLHVSQRGRYLNLANSYAEAKIETLRNQGYNSLSVGTTSLTSELSSQLPRTRSASMTVSSPSTGLKQVDLTVTYTDQGQSHSYYYTTLIGELGVGQ